MSKELKVAETNEVALTTGDWGNVEVSANDLVIQRLALMQGQSDLVTDGKAVLADIVNLATQAKVGGKDKDALLLPFYATKHWVTSVKKGSRYEFKSMCEDKGQVLPFEDGDIKNERQYTFFFLTEELSMPVVASFRSTSHKIGKALFSQMYITNIQAKQTPASYWIKLSSVVDKNDKGTFAVYSFKLDKKSSNEELKKCLEWIGTIKTSKAQVQEERHDVAPEATGPARF
jgi:hypothetical protein